MEVTLTQMLEARERRVRRQRELNGQWKKTLISFSMNIPGPVKCDPVIQRGFREGCGELESKLSGAVLHREQSQAVTGCEGLYVVDLAPEQVKAITTEIEDTHPLGRLFDMDVLDGALHKLDREAVGGGSRDCIVCGAPGRGCASRRKHSIPELQSAVYRILLDHFTKEDAKKLGSLAVESLLREVETTPKPGLVDRRNNGSHRDMDMALFRASARALEPYFRGCVQTGMETAQLPPEKTFPLLRKAGLQAEKTMFAVTRGINTHKGVIFTMGILCGAVGRLWTPAGQWEMERIFSEIGAMTQSAMTEDFAALDQTAGAKAYRNHGIRGIRGEVAEGLPGVAQVGLPAYQRLREQGMPENDAGVIALLHMLARVEDTCMIHRGGLKLARRASEKAAALVAQPQPSMSQIEGLDDWFIERNLSPGGCADLLAAVYFLDSLQNLRVNGIIN